MCETPPGPVVEEVCTAEITHLWRAGGRLIRPANGGPADLPGGFAPVMPAKEMTHDANPGDCRSRPREGDGWGEVGIAERATVPASPAHRSATAFRG